MVGPIPPPPITVVLERPIHEPGPITYNGEALPLRIPAAPEPTQLVCR